ncbi:Limbic system-associated membrane protein CHLAMP G19-isoform E19S, partial [Takifugu flavidus]
LLLAVHSRGSSIFCLLFLSFAADPLDGDEYLDIIGIMRNQAGRYECKASNDVAMPDVKYVNVVVNYPPTIKKTQSSETQVGRMGTLQCEATAVPTPEFEWYRDEKRFGPENLSIEPCREPYTHKLDTIMQMCEREEKGEERKERRGEERRGERGEERRGRRERRGEERRGERKERTGGEEKSRIRREESLRESRGGGEEREERRRGRRRGGGEESSLLPFLLKTGLKQRERGPETRTREVQAGILVLADWTGFPILRHHGVPPDRTLSIYRLSNSQSINIQILGTTTILMIANVTDEDYGNYTCVASNRLGVQNASLFLYRPGTGRDINGSSCVSAPVWLLLSCIAGLFFKS